MKVLSRNLEILLLNNDLVMIPGFGGFVVDYRQASFESQDSRVMLPPARFVIFNKELCGNDGLMVNAYMQNFDATYPQALRQLELDVERLKDELNENGLCVLNNVGTLRKNIDGVVSFEQMHECSITPAFFALPPAELYSVAELEKQEEILEGIHQTDIIPGATGTDGNNVIRTAESRKRWKDIAIASAAAVAMFFVFSFPYFRTNNSSDKIIAGAVSQSVENADVKADDNKAVDANAQNNVSSQPVQPQQTVLQPQIIVLQTPQANSNAIVISQQDLSQVANLSDDNGKYTIVVTIAANQECAQSLINKLADKNLPGAFYYEDERLQYVMYSRFSTEEDARKALNALKPMHERFKKAWVKKLP